MILAFCTIILAAAVISGIFAGRATNKKTLFICGGIMLAAALLSVTMAFICCDTVTPQEQFRYLHKIGIDPFKNSFWSRIITECRLFTHLISLNFISACTLFLLSFNSFRYFKSLRKAFITLILFIVGNFLLFMPIFSTASARLSLRTPAVSERRRSTLPSGTVVVKTSRVVPSTSVTIAASSPSMAL